MSGPAEELFRIAEENEKKEQESAGIAQGLDQWRDSLPEARIPDQAVNQIYLDAQEAEGKALLPSFPVSTSRPEDILGADTPTPGPDDEEGSPDEAGEGAGADDAPEEDVDLVSQIEGLWQPPVESEAENYIEPTTDEIVTTDEWIENAKLLYGVIGGGTLTAPSARPGELPLGNPFSRDKKPEATASDEDIANWAKNTMSGFNWNLVVMGDVARRVFAADDPKAALAFLNIMNMYDHSDGGRAEFGKAIAFLAADPTTYAGLGIGSLAAKGAAKATAKKSMSMAVKTMLVAGSAGLVEGAAVTGTMDATVQNIEQEAKVREDLDLWRTGKATAFGGAAGLLLGGSVGYLGGRYADKLTKFINAHVDSQITATPRTPEEELQKAIRSHKNFEELVMVQARLASVTGDVDDVQRIAIRRLTGDDEMPLLPGTDEIDRDALIKKLMDVPVGGGQEGAKAELRVEELAAKWSSERWGMSASEAAAKGELPAAEAVDGGVDLATWQFDDNQAMVELQQMAKDLDLDVTVKLSSDIEGATHIKDPKNAETIQIRGSNEDVLKLMQAENASFEKAVATGKAIDDVVEATNKENSSWNVTRTAGGVRVISTDEHVGPVADVASELGLEISIADGVDGFDLTVKGDDNQIIGWFEEISRVPTEAEHQAAKQAFKDAGIDFDAPPKPKVSAKVEPESTLVSRRESEKLADLIIEMDEVKSGEIMVATPGRKGTTVVDEIGARYEVQGRTKNGWYRLIDQKDGTTRNMRRKDFEIFEAPPPSKAGVMELAPFDDTAARIIAMAERASENPLDEPVVSHRERFRMMDDLKAIGIDIEEKALFQHWDATEMLWLREVYNGQANAILKLARDLTESMKLGGAVDDATLAFFNQAHTKFIATRDLFYGVSSNAARTLNILRSKPRGDAYDIAQSVMDSINLSGGRANTERTIKILAKQNPSDQTNDTAIAALTRRSAKIANEKAAAIFIQARYNMMLSSWRTHFKNYAGNTASGLWETIILNPLRFGLNNAWHMEQLAFSKIAGTPPPDPATRITLRNVGYEFRATFSGARESLLLAKRIAMGEELGEGKIWNEVGLRYDVRNVPDSMFGKLGTTPVRLLEAGDAFFKNQYYKTKLHGLAEQKANAEVILSGRKGKDAQDLFEKRFSKWVDDADPTMEAEAKEFASKLTYTNDPNVYGGILGAIADVAQKMQSRHPFFQVLMPFVRTPANLLSYSMEMIGANHILAADRSLRTLLTGSPAEKQEMITRTTAAIGLIAYVRSQWEEGNITGAGPTNFEEKKAAMAAGWSPNSAKFFGGDWVDLVGIQPAGQALTTIASVFDFMSMNDMEDEPMTEYLGALVLTIADQVKDDSYMSTITDLVVAIDAKKEGRIQSIVASTVSSYLVPNIVRDIRRVTDQNERSITSTNVGDQLLKQMINALPFLSDKLPPKRDWRGDPVVYYGNSYQRGVIPFNMRDADHQDPASMALAYARVPLGTPDRSMTWFKKNPINLFAMDEGEGYVYDKYVQFVGIARAKHVDAVIAHRKWAELVADDNIGPGSDGDRILRAAVGRGSREGRLVMLDFLLKNDEFKRANGNTILIHHPISKAEYKALIKAAREENIPVPDDKKQYEIQERKQGPEFFKP